MTTTPPATPTAPDVAPAAGAAPRGLRLAADLVLPPEAVTRTFAVLAVRGAGKTYAASVLTEELVGAGLPVAVIDPVGVWWGLRAGADGKGPGLPVAVLGGDHGDVPLAPAMGEAAADLLVDERLPVVLDLSLFRKGEQRRFVADLAERLYHRNRAPLHLVLDEADLWAPQRPPPGQQRLLGAVEDLVRRGRARGVGVTLVSQRPAVLAKDVLSQVDVLVALRLVAPQDRAALDAWVRTHGTPEEREQLQRSLPSLAVGEAWVWSPGWLGLLRRVRIRRRATFDSSRTPEAGERPAAPRALAPVDVARLRERLAGPTEAGGAPPAAGAGRTRRGRHAGPSESPPGAPRAGRIVERVEVPVEVRVEVPVEVPVLTDAQAAQLAAALGRLEAVAREVTAAAGALRDALQRVAPATAGPAGVAGASPVPGARSRRPGRRGDPGTGGPAPAPPPGPDGAADGALPAPQRRLLDALATFAAAELPDPDRRDVAALAGQSPTSSSLEAHLKRLRDAGLVETFPGGRLGLTAAGRALAPAPDDRAVDLRVAWQALLPAPQLRLLDALATLVRLGVPAAGRGDAAVLAGQSPTSSAFEAHAKRLRDRGLLAAAGPGRLTLTERGRRVAAPLPEVAGAADLHRAWAALLPPAQERLLRVLLDRHPAAVARDALAREAGQSPTSSSFEGHLRRLRGLGLAEAAAGGLRAGATLFPVGGAGGGGPRPPAGGGARDRRLARRRPRGRGGAAGRRVAPPGRRGRRSGGGQAGWAPGGA